MATRNKFNSPFVASAFLMATSAIGPGFLTQTALFTHQLMASFGFVILISILLDLGAQINIWRILVVSKKRAQDVANYVFPGAGYLLTAAIVLGGLAFNIGNLAGTGLGLEILTGLDPKTGAAISAAIIVAIFISRKAMQWMDGVAKIMGIVMIVLTLYVVIIAKPPLWEALLRTFDPGKTDLKAIIILVGGTVGGYISFAGGHRLIDSGVSGVDALPAVTRAATGAILLASVMRVLLFLAALGVLSGGKTPDLNNPAASVFELAAGRVGYLIFGVVMWCAAITSVIGSAYTSVSFLKTVHPKLPSIEGRLVIAFVLISALIFILIGQPVKILLAAGFVNGFILPFALGLMLIAVYKKKLIGDYRHPVLFTVIGVLVVVLTTWMSIRALMML